MYTIDVDGYGWRAQRQPYAYTRIDLLQLFRVALYIKIRRGTNERKRRLGSRKAGAAKPPGSKLKRAALRHKRAAIRG